MQDAEDRYDDIGSIVPGEILKTNSPDSVLSVRTIMNIIGY